MMRQSIRVDFADGNQVFTEINGTEDEIREYYVGTYYNFGDTDAHPEDKMVEVVGVTFFPVHHCDDDGKDAPLMSACARKSWSATPKGKPNA